jgi:lysophospholipase L1-like esterase
VDRLRILFLGDSFTFGLGVDDAADTFPEIMEKELNATCDELGVAGVDVLNGGLPGSLTRRWLQVWNDVAERFDPDVVISVFFLRDGTDLRTKEDFFEPLRREILARNARSWLYRSSYVYRILRDRSDRQEVSRRYVRRFLDAYGPDRAENRQWRLAQRNLLELRALAAERSTKFGLVIFPVLADLGEGYPFEPILDEIERFASTHDLETLNLMAAFRGRSASRLWVSAWNQHPNEEAHAIVAESLLPFVRKLLSGTVPPD